MHLPFTPNHILLVAACYPPAAALLSPTADYRPNGPELSRLTYYAANRPGKITKLTAELEKRAGAEARKAKAGNQRSRASLLVTLAIFKALVIECRRELQLLSPALITSVANTLSLLESDVEVVARVASLFAAWATYTDGQLIGLDTKLTENYMSALKCFGRLSNVEIKTQDDENRNRMRLIGLSALTAAVASEALYGASSQFRMQVDIIIDSILATTHFSELSDLEEGVSELKDKPSQNVSEFRERPIAERRAPSIYGHVDGEEGPKHKDVVIACLRTLCTLLGQSNAPQISAIMQASFESLDRRAGWDKPLHCTWFAQHTADWAAYQYRYAVPTLLVEHLLEVQDAPTATPAQHALVDMVTTVFTSPAPLVNLSTSDIISNLISLLFRRVSINPEDELLPGLVECIAALGTHVYYADQIQDLAGELIGRMQVIEARGVPGRQEVTDASRSQALRCLLLSLIGLIQAADKQVYTHDGLMRANTVASKAGDAKPQLEQQGPAASEATIKPTRPSRRAKIDAEVWQDTLTLLCDGTYAVRADYTDALITYLRTEIAKDGETKDSDGVRRAHSLSAGPTKQAQVIGAAIFGDAAKRFLNALHGYLYLLATSRSLGHNTSSTRAPSRESPNPSTSPDDTAHNSAGDDESASNSRQGSRGLPTVIAPRSRKISMTQRILNNALSGPAPAASASDYAHLLAVLTTVHEQLPVRGLLTGVPMLVALAEATRSEMSNGVNTHRARAVEEVVARTWRVIGRVWDIAEINETAENVLSTLGSHSYVPELPTLEEGLYHAPREPAEFVSDDSVKHSSLVIDATPLLAHLAASANVQDATGMDQATLLAYLSRAWTPELAFKESVEPDPSSAPSDTSVPKIAPALMHIENLSLANLNRPSRGVGVTELREALSGRSSMSNTALPNRAASVSTFDHASSLLPEGLTLAPTRSRGQKKQIDGSPNEVRDVLNKLGIGKQSSNGLLKAPFNTGRSPSKKPSNTFAPPYRT